jgi:uncharacterized protein YqfB (UPF0267 family)
MNNRFQEFYDSCVRIAEQNGTGALGNVNVVKFKDDSILAVIPIDPTSPLLLRTVIEQYAEKYDFDPNDLTITRTAIIAPL